MFRQAVVAAGALAFAGSALGQMTLVGDDRYTEYYIQIFNLNGFSDESGDNEFASFGAPFASSIGDSLFFSASNGNASADQTSSVAADLISAQLECDSFSDASIFESVYTAGYSQVDVVFSVAAPSPYVFEVTSWLQSSGGQAAAWIETSDGSVLIEQLTGVGSAGGTLDPGEYHLYIAVLSEVYTEDFPPDSESARVHATLSVTTAGGCSPADLTTPNAPVGDPNYGVPDGTVTAADLQYYVNAWVAGDLAIADVTTPNAPVGDPNYGVPDGTVTAADIQYYVNLWVLGCP